MIAQAFLVGKLPAHGDFVTRGLPLSVSRAWDAWCGMGLERTRAALGIDFDDRFRIAGRWRFCLASGVLDAGWHVGTIQPAGDRIGRPYLLVAGAHVAAPPCADTVERVAAMAEERARMAIAAGWRADRLLAALGEIGGAAIGDGAQPSRLWTEGDGREGARSMRIAALDPALIPMMLDVEERV